ncbi:conserved hypothetical protein [Trichinella spiralis]|uniref:hypothetical protein n=1 Tax=Trichinella spiralis TaxID=6334 RepID=UPI0001EFDB2D|nr:conserved hypothetical protein [Trichinella spiralis]
MKGPAPVVTGLSPKDGVPGTQIVIRGEHLGLSQSDVIGLTVCNADCMQSLKWESSHKIITRVSHCKAGTGPLQPTAVWVDESRMIETFRRDPKEAAAIVDDCPLGFSVETNVFKFSFENLKAGLEFMRSQVIVSKKGPKEFMKSNLSCILDCIDAMSGKLKLCNFSFLGVLNLDLRLHVEQDCFVNPTEMAEQFQTKIDHCIQTGEDVFVDVLKRKEQSDAIRNALSLLQRFRFMFYLPQLMKVYTEKIFDVCRFRSRCRLDMSGITMPVVESFNYRLSEDTFYNCAALVFNAIFPVSKIPSELVDLYDDAFLQWDVSSMEPAYLLQLLKSLRSTVAGFLDLECEERYLQYWMDLCVEIRLHCLACFVEQTESSISALASKEIWKLLVCNEEMSKTALPDLFESIIHELLPIFKQLLCYNNYRKEVDFLSSESHKDGLLKRFERLLCSFKLTMLKLIGLEQQQQLDDDVVSGGGMSKGSSTFEFDYPKGRAKKSSRITDKKLLIVLANCDYLLRYCLPRLIDRLSRNGMWLTEPLQQASAIISKILFFGLFQSRRNCS